MTDEMRGLVTEKWKERSWPVRVEVRDLKVWGGLWSRPGYKHPGPMAEPCLGELPPFVSTALSSEDAAAPLREVGGGIPPSRRRLDGGRALHHLLADRKSLSLSSTFLSSCQDVDVFFSLAGQRMNQCELVLWRWWRLGRRSVGKMLASQASQPTESKFKNKQTNKPKPKQTNKGGVTSHPF